MQLMDYSYRILQIPTYCVSQSVISIFSNPIRHSTTKHIELHYHLIKDHILKGNIILIFVPTHDEVILKGNTKLNGFLGTLRMINLAH